jgi:hypothetical protein
MPEGAGFEKKEETTEIVLPEDRNLVRRLELKLREYRNRASQHRSEALRQGKNIVYTPPEETFMWDTEYKIKVLSVLLRNKRVTLEELERQVQGEGRLPFLRRAFQVIKAYAEGRLEDVQGGTGLPEIE